jgi:glycosyltransferase involved in cell wall biosynthesis
MRILHVVPSFGLGGMEKIICAVVNATTDRCQHTVLALDGCGLAAGWLNACTTQVIKLDKPSSRRMFFASLFKALRVSNPDLLMTYNWGATDAIWLGRLAGIRHIIHSEHGFNVEEGTTTLWIRDCIRFLVYRLSFKIIVVSHELEDMLGNRFLLSKNKIRRIPNGIDVSYYSSDHVERERVRKSLGFSDAECLIGFSGRLDPVKNLDLLFDIFRCCNPRDYPFRLLVVGDGPARRRLETHCQTAGLLPYVKFVGQQTEVLPYLRAMDVFLLTSLREQMPLTVLEAMSVGLPVITTGVGELRYMIDDGIEGFIRGLNAPLEAFVQPLQSLLYASKRKELGTAARQKVLEQFQIGTMLQDYTDLIDECIGEFAPVE